MEKNKKIMNNLVHISTMVTQSTNFFEIKDKIVDKMLEVIQPTKACVNLFFDNDYNNVYLVCSSTLDYVPKMFPSNSRIGTKLDFHQAYPKYIHEAVREKKIIYIKDIFEEPRAVDERELAKMEGYSGRIVFPLVLNYTVIGFLTCFLTEDDLLEEDDISFISSVASLMSLSIEITMKNEHTTELINKLRESITNVNEVITKLYLNNNVNEFMEDLNNQAKNLTKSEETFIVLDNFNYDYKIFSSVESKKRKKIDFQDVICKLNRNKEDGKYENNNINNLVQGLNYNNYIYYKLKEKETIIGYILCLNNEGYTADDINILELLSKQAMLAMKLYGYNKSETKHKLLANELNIINKQQKLIMNESAMDLNNNKELYFYHKAATIVGGDFYHSEVISENKIAYIIADVMGHGIVSNYIVAMIKGSFKVLCHQYDNANEIMTKLNEILYDEFDKMGVFTTCIINVIDTKENTVSVSNAGHYCPIIVDNKGDISCKGDNLCKKGVPIGVLEGIEYQQNIISLKDSSMICMFTDGIIEIKNKEKEEFGVDRLRTFLSTHHKLDKNSFIITLKQEIESFANKSNFDDDILLVCLGNKR